MNMEYNHLQKVLESQEKGLIATMNNIVERHRTELNNKLSDYFRDEIEGYNGTWSVHCEPDKVERVLDGINEYIETYHSDKFEYEIDFPDESGTSLYLIPITDNLELEVLIADEYYGDGEYEKYIEIDKFIINDNTTTEDVDKLVEFVNKYLTFKGE